MTYQDPDERFNKRVTRSGDCLIWTGTLNDSGYGRISVYGRSTRAHRYAWERVHGPIPDGMLIDHTCHTRACVNADHLRLVTNAENIRNRSGANRNNRSGVRNVYAYAHGWYVQITKDGERYHFGSYRNLDDAADAAERGRAELFGDYAGRCGRDLI